MLGQRSTWVRENSFDMIEVIADVHEDTMRRMHTGFDPELFILDYTTLNLRLPPKNLPWI